MSTGRRSLISLDEVADEDLRWMVDRGLGYATRATAPTATLAGRVVGVGFRKTSTRTRTAFSVGALRLGASLVTYGPNDLQEATGETVEDTGRVLSRMLDLFVVRTSGDPEEMRRYTDGGRLSVVNAMSSEEHPTQALTDLTTLAQHFGDVAGLSVLYVGEGNNTAVALAKALPRYSGTRLTVCTPPGYELPAEVLAQAVETGRRQGSEVVARTGLDELPDRVDVVYTTRWQTTGTVKPDPNWRDVFAPFRVDEQLMARCDKAVFMHDLPAHRGEDVTAGVLEGDRSIAFDQAENKMWSAMAVLEWCLEVG